MDCDAGWRGGCYINPASYSQNLFNRSSHSVKQTFSAFSKPKKQLSPSTILLYSSPPSEIKMVRIDVTLICVCLPLILAAPADETLKQQMSGLYRTDGGYWNMIAPGESDGDTIEVETRGAVESLGRGNILKRSYDDGLGLGLGDWGTPKAGWRFGAGDRISGKRGGSLDSLGRGHILRSAPESQQEELLFNVFRSWLNSEHFRPLTFAPRSLDSLGRDNSGHPLRRLEEALQQQQQFGPPHKKFDSLSGRTFGGEKRNFDEIDRTGFGSFVKKNFDEIDRNGFGFNKRNFDEIDRTGFGSFVKRST